MRRSQIAIAAVAAASILSALPASASLVGALPFETSGTGLGSEETILTVNATPTEQGCVARGAGVDVIGPLACPPGSGLVGGNEQTGTSQTQTRSLAELGLTSAQNLRIVFNANENSGDSITLNELRLVIHSDAGALLFDSGPFTDQTLPFTFEGTGTAGFVYQLDAAQAAAANAFFGDSTNRIGISAALSDTSAGNETFFVADVAAVAPPPIPVPTASTWGLAFLGIALAGLGVFLMRRLV